MMALASDHLGLSAGRNAGGPAGMGLVGDKAVRRGDLLHKKLESLSLHPGQHCRVIRLSGAHRHANPRFSLLPDTRYIYQPHPRHRNA